MRRAPNSGVRFASGQYPLLGAMVAASGVTTTMTPDDRDMRLGLQLPEKRGPRSPGTPKVGAELSRPWELWKKRAIASTHTSDGAARADCCRTARDDPPASARVHLWRGG